MHPLMTAYLRRAELWRMPSIDLARFHMGELTALEHFIAELQAYGR